MMTKILLVGLSTLLGTTTFAKKTLSACQQEGSNLVFPKGKEMRVVKYDADTATYQVASVEFPGEGTLDVTLSALSSRVPKIRQIEKDLQKKPDDIVDAVYVADLDVPSLFEKEKMARKECLSKK